MVKKESSFLICLQYVGAINIESVNDKTPCSIKYSLSNENDSVSLIETCTQCKPICESSYVFLQQVFS